MLGVVLGTVALLWGLANTTGLVDDLEGFLRDAGFEDFRFQGERMFEQVAFIGAVGALAATVFMVLAAALLNLISEITGGIKFVVIEEIVETPAAPTRPPAPLALPTVPPSPPPMAAPGPAPRSRPPVSTAKAAPPAEAARPSDDAATDPSDDDEALELANAARVAGTTGDADTDTDTGPADDADRTDVVETPADEARPAARPGNRSGSGGGARSSGSRSSGRSDGGAARRSPPATRAKGATGSTGPSGSRRVRRQTPPSEAGADDDTTS
jgi:hypothetical protein